MREITTDELIDRVRNLSVLFPERAENCYYVQSDPNGNLEPQCIIGCALVEAGVSMVALEQEKSSFDFMYHRYNVVTDDKDSHGYSTKVQWLAYVQGAQDTGYTWEEAVKEASTYFDIAPV